MGFKKADFGTNITFKDDDGIHTFIEGDDIICIVGDNRYVGTITQIGYYNSDNETESSKAICINTSDKNNDRKYSSEVIDVDDITYICKNPLADTTKEEMSQEEIEQNTFITMICSLGYDKAEVETLYNNVKKTKDQFDIPMDKMIACTVYSLTNHCSIEVPLKDICGIDVEYMNSMIEQFENATSFSIGMAFAYFTSLLNDFVDEFLPKKKQK